jgi:hypothetical protein
MNIARPTPRNILLTLCLVSLAACQPPVPTPVAQQDIQITGITHTGCGRSFNQDVVCCNAAGHFTEVKFSEHSETFQSSLTVQAVW